MLIDRGADNVLMFGYVLLTFLVFVGPLAYFFGADSRYDEVARRRRNSS